MIPKGKGMYIWQPDRLGTPEFVAQKAQEVGLELGVHEIPGWNFCDRWLNCCGF